MDPKSKPIHDIEKDVNRTFPQHPYFNIENKGTFGQKTLKNVLGAYSVNDEIVGYCQSMNFMVGFLLMVSGGREKETYWVFNALL